MLIENTPEYTYFWDRLYLISTTWNISKSIDLLLVHRAKGKLIVRNPSEDNRKQNILLLYYYVIDAIPSWVWHTVLHTPSQNQDVELGKIEERV